MPAYEYRHVVSFQETSLVGNVYFSNYLLWQGHCREKFLHDFARETAELLARRELAFFTANCQAEFFGDFGFRALDEVLVRMRLERFRGGRMSLSFEYARADRPSELLARGAQEVHCKARVNGQWVPSPFPVALDQALLQFADTDELKAALRDAIEFHQSKAH
jgi:enediyne biosynthesis thioesterase